MTDGLTATKWRKLRHSDDPDKNIPNHSIIRSGVCGFDYYFVGDDMKTLDSPDKCCPICGGECFEKVTRSNG